jgi:CO/xanthine dehydrogenase Mo-binding subunit
VAVAAHKANAPVRYIYGRREDMEFTTKRHPSLTHYRVAVKDGKVTAMDIDVRFNGGAYTTLSAVGAPEGHHLRKRRERRPQPPRAWQGGEDQHHSDRVRSVVWALRRRSSPWRR